ncbi:MAG: aminoglycoside phosphotransferase family protein [Deinococcaceae bacterium]
MSIDWKTQIYLILIHPTQPKVWTLDGALPDVVLSEHVWFPEVSDVLPAMEALLGFSPHILYCPFSKEDTIQKTAVIAYVMASEVFPTQGDWVPRSGLPSISPPELLETLNQCFDELEGLVLPTARVPWAKPGWILEVCKWIEDQLSEHGCVPQKTKLIKNWSLSSVLEIQAQLTKLYFKVAADIPLFGNEPLVTRALAALCPECIPEVILIESQQRWMVTSQLDLLGEVSVDELKPFLKTFAYLQQKSLLSLDKLKVAGCLDRSLSCLKSQIRPLMADDFALRGLSLEELNTLRALTERVEEACDQLMECPIPHTLVHGDLHQWNMAKRDKDLVFFDWTDACISHPFFDLAPLLANYESDQETLLKAYLECWSDFASQDILENTWQLAQPLAFLHHAVSYQHMQMLEDYQRMEISSCVFWLRCILRFYGYSDSKTVL